MAEKQAATAKVKAAPPKMVKVKAAVTKRERHPKGFYSGGVLFPTGKSEVSVLASRLNEVIADDAASNLSILSIDGKPYESESDLADDEEEAPAAGKKPEPKPGEPGSPAVPMGGEKK